MPGEQLLPRPGLRQQSLEAVKLLGGGVTERRPGSCCLKGAQGRIKNNGKIDCQNSGTTMRLLMGILAGVSGDFELDGDESLRRRPMERVAKPLRQMGARKCKPPTRAGRRCNISGRRPERHQIRPARGQRPA